GPFPEPFREAHPLEREPVRGAPVRGMGQLHAATFIRCPSGRRRKPNRARCVRSEEWFEGVQRCETLSCQREGVWLAGATGRFTGLRSISTCGYHRVFA